MPKILSSSELTVIEQAEKQLDAHPKDQKNQYELAKLYMRAGNHIAALSLLKVACKQSTSAMLTEKIEEKIARCKKKVDAEVQVLTNQASKIKKVKPYISHSSKSKMTKSADKVAKKAKELLPIEASLVKLYTSNFYLAFNKYLALGEPGLKPYFSSKVLKNGKDNIISFLQKSIPIIKHSLKKMPSLKTLHPSNSEKDIKKRTVFRGLNVSSAFIHNIQNKGKMSAPGFTSTSANKMRAIYFTGTTSLGKEPLFVEVEDRAGKGVPIDTISCIKSEKEVLFPPNTEFTITEIQKVKKGDDVAKKILGHNSKAYFHKAKHLWVAKATT